jgi:hypothetical protein
MRLAWTAAFGRSVGAHCLGPHGHLHQRRQVLDVDVRVFRDCRLCASDLYVCHRFMVGLAAR